MDYTPEDNSPEGCSPVVSVLLTRRVSKRLNPCFSVNLKEVNKKCYRLLPYDYSTLRRQYGVATLASSALLKAICENLSNDSTPGDSRLR